MAFLLLLPIFLFLILSVDGNRKHISPLPGRSYAHGIGTSIRYVNASGLGDGNSFYNTAALQIQLMEELPVWQIHNKFHSNLFVGESENGMIAASIIKYTSNTSGISALVGSFHDRETGNWYELKPDVQGASTITEIRENDIPPLRDPPTKGFLGNLWKQVSTFDLKIAQTHFYERVQEIFSGGTTKANGDTIVDVMIIWTPNSECQKSNLKIDCAVNATTEATMEASIQLLMSDTNMALSNSDTQTQFNLVHMQRNDDGFREKAMTQTLSQLANPSDGVLDYIQSLRDQKNADLVQMVIDSRLDADHLGGVAYLPQRNTFGCYDSSLGFSVICSFCTTVGYIPAHEFGHNLGCVHDRGTLGYCTTGCRDMSAKNFGYRAPSGKFRTIMAYQCRTDQCDHNPSTSCAPIPYYSGNAEYKNESLGGDNNNCRSAIRTNKRGIARYQ